MPDSMDVSEAPRVFVARSPGLDLDAVLGPLKESGYEVEVHVPVGVLRAWLGDDVQIRLLDIASVVEDFDYFNHGDDARLLRELVVRLEQIREWMAYGDWRDPD